MATGGWLGQLWNSSSGTKSVTATPAVNDLIVIVTAHDGNTSAATPTDDQGGTYTTVVTAKFNADADTMMIHIRTALIPAAVSTVFTHAPGASTGGGLGVANYSGMTQVGATASRQVGKQENQASATPAPVFPAAALTTNPVLGAVFDDSGDAITPRSSPAYAEAFDGGHITPTRRLEVMGIDSGETATTITWGSSAGGNFCSAVVELDASSALPFPPLFHRQENVLLRL